MMKNIVCVFIYIFAVTCLLAEAAEIKISSTPQNALIYIKNMSTGKKVKFSKTPYSGNLEQLLATMSNANTIFFEIKKDGFETYHMLLVNSRGVDVDFKVKLEVNNDMKFTQDYDLLVDDLFDVQRFVRSKDFGSGLEKLKILEQKFPFFSIIDEMKASIFYLKKDYKKSLSYYRRAFAKNSKNRDAFKMKNYLEKKFNLSSIKK